MADKRTSAHIDGHLTSRAPVSKPEMQNDMAHYPMLGSIMHADIMRFWAFADHDFCQCKRQVLSNSTDCIGN